MSISPLQKETNDSVRAGDTMSLAMRKGLPAGWYVDDCLTSEEAETLLQPVAQVAQKCTGRAKKPVFLLPDKVVKGPWHLPYEANRLRRELGCAALMKHWALPEHPKPVLQASLYEHTATARVYMVTGALYPAPTAAAPWEIESDSRSVPGVGPRRLLVVSRASTGVVRVSDRLREEPGYLLDAPEVWEHLIHRCLLQCGDSGFHNMLIDPLSERAVGIDLDEKRRDCDADDWVSMLFKRPPARKLWPMMAASLEVHKATIEAIFARLEERCEDDVSDTIVAQHQLVRGDWGAQIRQLRLALEAYLKAA